MITLAKADNNYYAILIASKADSKDWGSSYSWIWNPAIVSNNNIPSTKVISCIPVCSHAISCPHFHPLWSCIEVSEEVKFGLKLRLYSYKLAND